MHNGRQHESRSARRTEGRKTGHARRARRTAVAVLTAGLIIAAAAAGTTDAWAAPGTLSDIYDEIDDAEEELRDLAAEFTELMGSLDGYGETLSYTMVELGTVEADIAAKQADVDAAREDYEEKEAVREEYYESMKVRIRYMYENGNTGLFASLLGEKTYAKIINRIEMFDALYDTDQAALSEYVDAAEAAEAAKDALEKEEAALEEMRETLEEQRAELEEQISEAAADAEDVEERMVELEELVEEYRAQAALMEGNAVYTEGEATEMGQAVVNFACQFVGNPYVWGGTSLTKGCDCSGFIVSVYKHFGVSLPHYSGSLRSVGVEVTTDDIRPGDIICYSGHCAIYVGNGSVVHASNPKPYPAGGIKYGNMYMKRIITVRRIFTDAE